MTVSAKVITDSISDAPYNIRITSLQLRYPKFIHGEIMTHRVFSRNASSSRAIPVERIIQDILDDTAMPEKWQKNKPGMQGGEECNEKVLDNTDISNLGHPYPRSREDAWNDARDKAIDEARAFHAAGYHKQIVNRLLEPFCHINVLVTSTDWANFKALRNHPDADPTMEVLGKRVTEALEGSTPTVIREGLWHLPYITEQDLFHRVGYDDDVARSIEDLIKVSVARCARVSYLTHDQKSTTIDEDLKLYERLLGRQPIHASPAEHQATPDASWSGSYYQPWGSMDGWKNQHLAGNFRGWQQYRKMLPGEYIHD